MKKLNAYYIESGYISCRGTRYEEDENFALFLTTLSIEEMKEEFLIYFWSNQYELIEISKYSFYESFLKSCAEKDGIYMDMNGHGYIPNISGASFETSYDIQKEFDLSSLLSKKEFNEHEEYIKKGKEDKKIKEQKEREQNDKLNEIRQKYLIKLKEREEYILLSKKFDKKFDENSVPMPAYPKELEPNSFKKFLIENGHMKKEDLLKIK